MSIGNLCKYCFTKNINKELIMEKKVVEIPLEERIAEQNVYW